MQHTFLPAAISSWLHFVLGTDASPVSHITALHWPCFDAHLSKFSANNLVLPVNNAASTKRTIKANAAIIITFIGIPCAFPLLSMPKP